MVQLVHPRAERRLIAPQLGGALDQRQEQIDADREVRRGDHADTARLRLGRAARLLRLPSGRADDDVHAAGGEPRKILGHGLGQREVDRHVGLRP